MSIIENEGCIILNKPFIGGYIDRSNENEAHELINFFLDDKGKHFIYCSPYGQNVKSTKKKEKRVEYFIFTSNTKNKSFYIEYIVKIDRALHNVSLPKQTLKHDETIKNKITEAQKQIDENLKKLGYKKGIEDVKYGGISIKDLFTDSIKVIPLTFLAKEIYKVTSPIKIEFLDGEDAEEIFDYNFQRNFGYVTSESKKPKAYKTLKKKIDDIIQTDKVEKQTFEKFVLNKNVTIKEVTFIDLISMFRQEECYTQILYKLFDYKKEFIGEFVEFLAKEKKIGCDSAVLNGLGIKAEYAIEGVGRLDLYAYNSSVNIIMENKIDSGINYKKVKNTEEKIDQLKRYYEYFEEKNAAKNIYILICPDEKISYLEAEIKSLIQQEEDKNSRCYKSYNIVGYNLVYEFFKDRKLLYDTKDFEYRKYMDDIIEIFRRLSLTRQQMCEENLLNNIRKTHIKNSNGAGQTP